MTFDFSFGYQIANIFFNALLPVSLWEYSIKAERCFKLGVGKNHTG